MRPEIRRLFPLIELDPVDRLEGVFPTTVEVRLKDGRVLSETRAMPLGSKAAPFTSAQYWEKYESCVAGVLSDSVAAELRRVLERLPELSSIREMTRHLAFEPARS